MQRSWNWPLWAGLSVSCLDSPDIGSETSVWRRQCTPLFVPVFQISNSEYVKSRVTPRPSRQPFVHYRAVLGTSKYLISCSGCLWSLCLFSPEQMHINNGSVVEQSHGCEGSDKVLRSWESWQEHVGSNMVTAEGTEWRPAEMSRCHGPEKISFLGPFIFVFSSYHISAEIPQWLKHNIGKPLSALLIYLGCTGRFWFWSIDLLLMFCRVQRSHLFMTHICRICGF